MEALSFSQFYSGIRAHFSTNTWEYEKFKSCQGNRAKVEFLISHDVVKKSLANLASRNTQIPLCAIFGPPARKPRSADSVYPNPLVSGSEKYPQMSKKVEVKVTKKKGRFLVAKEKIEPGEVLIHERPFCTMLYAEFSLSHCNFCFKRILTSADGRDQISCPHCKQVNYCSDACRSMDFDWFHWAECGLRDRLQDEALGRLALLVFRLMVKSGLKTCIDTHDADLTLIHKNCTYDSDDYASAFLQVSHEDDRDPGDAFKRTAISLYLTHHLKLAGFFPSYENEDFYANQDVVTVVYLILRHLQSSSCNAYEIDEFVSSKGDAPNGNVSLGGAVYPTVSLSNHSCAHNTIRNYEGSTCIIRSTLTIHKGEEILDNYGLFYQVRGEAERKEALATQYFFRCECQACKLHWPTFPEFRGNPTIFVCSGCKTPLGAGNCAKLKKCTKCKRDLKQLAKTARALANFGNDVKMALQTINGNCASGVDAHLPLFMDYLKLMETSVQQPCSDFVTCQQIISQCFAMKANVSFL